MRKFLVAALAGPASLVTASPALAQDALAEPATQNFTINETLMDRCFADLVVQIATDRAERGPNDSLQTTLENPAEGIDRVRCQFGLTFWVGYEETVGGSTGARTTRIASGNTQGRDWLEMQTPEITLRYAMPLPTMTEPSQTRELIMVRDGETQRVQTAAEVGLHPARFSYWQRLRSQLGPLARVTYGR